MNKETQITISVSDLNELVNSAVRKLSKLVSEDLRENKSVCVSAVKGGGGACYSLVRVPELESAMRNAEVTIDIVKNEVNVDIKPNYSNNMFSDQDRIVQAVRFYETHRE
jgi:hypothetical protein